MKDSTLNTDINEHDDKQKPDANTTSWLKWPIRIFVIVLLGYIGIVVFLLVNETRLVYPGSKYPKGNWEPANFEFEEVKFKTTDGLTLYGWFLPAPDSDQTNSAATLEPSSPDANRANKETVLLCHGNAENIAESSFSNGDLFRRTLNADVFVYDYRGYGKCEGTPTEKGVLADSEAAMEWLMSKTGKEADEIVLVGHSLGGGPAVHLAHKYSCKALILQRTFDRITSPASNLYPWIPIRALMQNQYPSDEKIQTVNRPLFQSHGAKDRLIPIRFGKNLFDQCPCKQKQFFEVAEMTHWDALPSRYWKEMVDFVKAIEPVSKSNNP